MSMTYLQAETLRFSLNENGILSLDLAGESYSEVKVSRLFPFHSPEEMLSVSVKEEEQRRELGILRRLEELPAEQQAILRDYLRYQYFIPHIEKIGKIEDKLGYVYMEVTTELGTKTICIADITSNLRQMEDGTIYLVDVQGNRYCIENLRTLSRENRQKIEIYL